ncbi:MAG: DAK2 domain-containing protein [Bacilli bacterium]|nr:DAK2 domain-containing protein [Bacilli bacterium]
MILKKMNGVQFKELIVSGAKNLRAHYQEVDNLNVFPVPDGDTGTNMCRTIEGGVSNIIKEESKSLSDIAKVLSKGMLLGARGNSGVILSQIYRGICRSFEGKQEVDAKQLAEAYRVGVKQAYAAVITPVEGTILTVFREATEYAAKKMTKESTINEFFELHLKQASKSLKMTKELLPVLKEADVIDSGGAGYVYIVKGIVKYLGGEVIDAELDLGKKDEKGEEKPAIDFSAFSRDDELTFGYCTEFILRLQSKKVNVDEFDVQTIIDILNSKEISGDSIVALKDDDVVKVHVHTKDPGLVLHEMRQFGEFLTTKVENMSLQHNENMTEEEKLASQKREHKKYAIVAVAQGEGICSQFEALGVDVIVKGNQTMNPSTEDFLKAFKQLDAENIIVFPNNKNIIMAAKQAAGLYKAAKVKVAASNFIPQCYSALTMLDFSSDDLELIMGNFNAALRNVVSGSITTAIRSTRLNGVNIRKGENLCIVDGKVVASTINKYHVVGDLLRKIPDIQDKQLLTVFFGKDCTEAERKKNMDWVKQKYPHLEVGCVDGGQAVYKFLLAIE